MKKLLFVTLIGLFAACRLQAQTIANIRAEQQGTNIVVYYDINGAQAGQTFDVQLFCSTDGGNYYGNPLQRVSGDVGNNITPATAKRIVWDVLAERTDLVSANIKFKVKATIHNPTNPPGTFTDNRDGHVYKWVQIGTQVWMAENLAYLPQVCPLNQNCGYWVYDYQSNNVAEAKATQNYKTYGVLYNWQTAQNVCPSGWHLPSDAEWNTLINYLGGADVAGGKMKATSGWNSPNTGATNSSGFTAFPGGYRCFVSSGFGGRGAYADFWSSTPDGSESAWSPGLGDNYGKAYRSSHYRTFGFSVRCVKD